MKNSKITISLFRVSTDSQYLDMMFECSQEYYFNSLMLEIRMFDTEVKKFKSQFFDLSTALFVDSEGTVITDKHEWVVRLPLSKLGIYYPAIYKATFKIQKLESSESEEVDCDCQNGECLEDHAICSDVNQAYKCMLDELMKLEEPCFEISDELIRKYLLLYGHQSALSLGDYDAAERYFKLITNCFDMCANTSKCTCCDHPVKISNNSCNCHKS